jgi:hypothetical protein
MDNLGKQNIQVQLHHDKSDKDMAFMVPSTNMMNNMDCSDWPSGSTHC